MPIPPERLAPTGRLIPHGAGEIAALGLQTRGIRDGSSRYFQLKMGSTTGVITYFCDPAFEWSAITYFLGAVSVWNDSGTKRLSRLMPFTLADWGMPRVGVTEVRRRGFKFIEDDQPGDVPLPSHLRLELELTLEILPFETGADEDTTFEYQRYTETYPDEDMAEYVTMPGVSAGIQYVRADGAAVFPHRHGVPYNVGIPVLKSKVRRKWHRIPKDVIKSPTSPFLKRLRGDPGTGALPYIGTSNKTSIFNYPPGSLVLKAPKVERVPDPVASDYAYNVVFEWDYLPGGGLGANALYAYDPTKPPGVNLSGWYQVSRSDTYAAPGTITSDPSVLFPEREHANVFDIG